MHAQPGVRLLAATLVALLAVPALPAATVLATEPTTTAVGSSASPSTYGESITFSATVTAAVGIPTGGVQFKVDGANLGTAVALAGGSATSEPTSTLTAGTHSVTAEYVSDDPVGFNDSSGTLPGDQVVNQAGQATLTVTASSPATYGTSQTLTTSGGSGSGAVTYDDGTSTACSVSGTTLTITAGSGTCAVTATKAADANYNAATSAAAPVTVARAGQTITFGALADRAFDASPITVSATASSGLTVSFASQTLPVCTTGGTNGTTVTFVTVGSCTVRASQVGNANYNAAADVDQTFAIGATAQTITFAALGGKTYGAAPFTVSATASSGLPVSFSSLTVPVCTVSGSTVTILAAGTCTVRASQGGNATWSAAPNVDQPFTVAKAGQAITFSQPGGKVYGDAPYTPTATATSGLPVAFSSTTPAVCTSDGWTVTIVGAGSCTLIASQAGNANYNAATSVSRSLTVSKKAVTVTANDKSRRYGAPDPTFDAAFAGLVGADNPGTPACSTTSEAPKVVGGVYPINCTGALLSTANYTYTLQPGTLTITAAPLIVTADNTTRQYGLANPSLTATLSGFVNNETLATASVTGAASCTTGALVTNGVGSHGITCSRGTLAAPNYDFPTFVGGTLTITRALPAPVVGVNVNPAPASALVTFTAAVTWPTGTPTGTVTFFDDATPLSGPLPLDGGGRASFATNALPTGSHAIRAVYSGDGANFGGATSTPFTQVVGTSNVNVVLTTNRPTWETKVPITFTATLAPDASGVTVPVTGTVTFQVDGAVRATVPVASGTASYASPPLASGSHEVLASYTPDPPGSASFNAGVSAKLTQTVVANTVRASAVGLSGTSIYPVADSWRDTVAVRGSRLEPLSVSIAIYSPTGARVRTKTFARASGSYTYTWNGRTSSGTILAAGRYRVVQVVADAYGARRTYTSYVALSRKRMYWYTKTLYVTAGPRNYQMRSTTDTKVLSPPSSTTSGALGMVNRTSSPTWIAVGYQFSLPSASTYRSLSFQVRGRWTGATAPKIGLVPWSSGSWFAGVYHLTRPRATMGTSTTSYYAQTLTSLGGIVSGRSVRASIDSFAAPAGYGPGPFGYSITSVRLVVRYGILR